ncbi:MAG: hypothetical protein MJK04_25495, partial [Psychrosphaera sp.]|nr:hypothetical protein [Psychrosphaera sp.]
MNLRKWGDDNLTSRIKTITNGFGLKTTIAYKPLTDPTVYTKGQGAHEIDDYGRGSPVFDLIMPTQVVSSITSDAPSYNAAGNTYDATATLTVNYTYQGLRAQTGGRGLLGYEKITSVDPQSGITTQTTYRQDFPYIGMPLTTKQCVGSNCDDTTTLLSSAENTYNDDANAPASTPTTLHGGEIKTPHIYQSATDAYALNSNGTNSFINSVKTTNTHQEAAASGYLELSQVTVETYPSANAAGAVQASQTTVNLYDADNADKWWINRVSKVTVTHARAGLANIVRTSGFEYDGTTGLLNAQIIEPDKAGETNSQTYLKTAYKHDAYGNIVTTTQCSQHYAEACGTATAVDTEDHPSKVYRQAKATFDGKGRYVDTSSDNLFTLITVGEEGVEDGRNALGAVTTSTNIDGVISQRRFDNFGRLFYSWNSTGVTSSITRKLKAAATPASWPTVDEQHHFVSQL